MSSVASDNTIAEAIYLASKETKGQDEFALAKRVTQFLFNKRLLSRAPDILARLEKVINKEEGRIVAKVSSKNTLDGKTKKELRDSLGKRYKAREVILEEKIDPKFLGGFRVEVDDEVIDLTLKNKMDKLQAYLTSKA